MIFGNFTAGFDANIWKKMISDRVLLAIFLIVFLFSTYSMIYWKNNYKYCSACSDTAFEINALFNSVSGNLNNFFYSTLGDRSMIHDHTNLTFLLYIIIFYIFPSFNTYYFLHGLTLSIGAIPVYKISELKFKSRRIAFLFSLLFLFNPLTILFLKGKVLLRTYSAIPFLLFTWYFYEKKNFRYFTIFLILSLLTKENISLVSIMMGLYFWIKGDKKYSKISFIGGILIFLLYLSNLFGYFDASYHKVIEIHFGKDFIENKLYLNPFNVFERIFSVNNINYLIIIFSFFSFLPLVAPEILIIAVPKFLENLLYVDIDITSKNNAILFPLLFISMIYGTHNLKKRIKNPNLKRHSTFLIFLVLFFGYIIFFNHYMIFSGYVHRIVGVNRGCKELMTDTIYGTGLADFFYYPKTDAYDLKWNYVLELKDKLPKNASLVVDRSLTLPFADRPGVYMIHAAERNQEKIEYIVLNEELIDCLENKDSPLSGDFHSKSRYYSYIEQNNMTKISQSNGISLFGHES